jgi:hypothetical protein
MPIPIFIIENFLEKNKKNNIIILWKFERLSTLLLIWAGLIPCS